MDRRALVAASAMLATGCLLMTDLSGLTRGAQVTSGVDDAGADAELDARADAEADAELDARADATSDADGPKETCSSSIVLVGSSELAATLDNTLGPGAVDAFGYVAKTAGMARCAWLYVSSIPSGGLFSFAVYSNAVTKNVPGALRARATLSSVVAGWNAARLDQPFAVAVGDTVWLAYGASGNSAKLRTLVGCSTPLSSLTDFGASGTPRDPFVVSQAFPTICNAAAFLAP